MVVQCSINILKLGSAHLACALGQRLCTRRTAVGALVLWGSVSWRVMADAAITQSGLPTGPDNHLLEVRLALPSDRSLSWICLPALCTLVGKALHVWHPFPALVEFHTSHLSTYFLYLFHLTVVRVSFLFIHMIQTYLYLHLVITPSCQCIPLPSTVSPHLCHLTFPSPTLLVMTNTVASSVGALQQSQHVARDGESIARLIDLPVTDTSWF